MPFSGWGESDLLLVLKTQLISKAKVDNLCFSSLFRGYLKLMCVVPTYVFISLVYVKICMYAALFGVAKLFSRVDVPIYTLFLLHSLQYWVSSVCSSSANLRFAHHCPILHFPDSSDVEHLFISSLIDHFCFLISVHVIFPSGLWTFPAPYIGNATFIIYLTPRYAYASSELFTPISLVR